MKPNVYDSRGQRVPLGTELGSGGEGSVFEVIGQPNLAAKVYDRPADREKATKLLTMARLRTDRLLRLAAWPVDTLHDRPGGVVKGFLMPKLSDFKAIHTLYGPKSRLMEFPNADWRFLIHAATNAARAFAVIHEHGHVVGDVNHANLLVSKQATVMLIDCDSFQVMENGHHYLCEVGVLTHTPPELQGFPSFRGVVRTANHDAFGLAVLIFQLLFMGRHPFSGRYLAKGEMPLEKAIMEFRFAYGANAKFMKMEPPPGTLPLEAVSQPVALLFERAFSQESAGRGTRPNPQEWVWALNELPQRLRQCTRHSGHYFVDTLTSCPWCKLEVVSGVVLFPIVITGVGQPAGIFNVDAVWAQIMSVQSPSPLPVVLPKSCQPSQKALHHSRARRSWRGLLNRFVSIITKKPDVRVEFEKALREAQAHLQSVNQRWQAEAGDGKFQSKLQDLGVKMRQYQELPALRQQKLRQLAARLREDQLHKFLERHRIQTAVIRDIGPTRKATLQSYGIETAADVTEHAILAVPGFGPVYTSRLLDWRRSVERQFVFNPAKGVDPADIAAVDRELAAARQQIEQELRAGPTVLRQIHQQIMTARSIMRPMLEQALNAVAQAEADLRVL